MQKPVWVNSTISVGGLFHEIYFVVKTHVKQSFDNSPIHLSQSAIKY